MIARLHCLRGVLLVSYLICLMAADNDNTGVVPSYIQVAPYHSAALGASTPITISGTALRGAVNVTLDGIGVCSPFDGDDASSLQGQQRWHCHVASLDRKRKTLFDSNNYYEENLEGASRLQVGKADGTIDVIYLNKTFDGTFARYKDATPVVVSVSHPAIVLNVTRIAITWRPASITSPGTKSEAWLSQYTDYNREVGVALVCPLRSVSDLSSVDLQTGATLTTRCPGFRFMAAALLNVSIVDTKESYMGIEFSSIVWSRDWYSLHKTHSFPERIVRTRNESLKGATAMISIHPSVFGSDNSTGLIQVLQPRNSSTVSMYFRIKGTFPSSTAPPIVTVAVAAHPVTLLSCDVVQWNVTSCECIVSAAQVDDLVDSATTPAVDPLSMFTPVGGGYFEATALNSSTSETLNWNVTAKSLSIGESGDPTRRLVRAIIPIVPSHGNVVRVHCSSTATVLVLNRASQSPLCEIKDDSRWMSNSTAATLRVEECGPWQDAVEYAAGHYRLSIEAQCVGECHISLEYITEKNRETPTLFVTAVVELASLTAIPSVATAEAQRITSTRRLRSASRTRSIARDGVPFFLTTTMSLLVPVVGSAAECTLLNATDLLIPNALPGGGAELAQRRYFSVRFASYGLSGLWMNGRCHWSVALLVDACDSVLQPPTHIGRLVYCGPKENFLDPIPLTSLQLDLGTALGLWRNGASDSSLIPVIPVLRWRGFPLAVPVPGIPFRTIALNFTADKNSTNSNASLSLSSVTPMIVAANTEISLMVDGALDVMQSFAASLFAAAYFVDSDTQSRYRIANVTVRNGTRAPSLRLTTAIPATLPAGRYVIVVFPVRYPSLSCPSLLSVRCTVTWVSPDAVFVSGGGIVTMTGSNFPPPSRLRLIVPFSPAALNGSFVEGTLLSWTPTRLAWTMPSLSNVTGSRLLNTITAQGMLAVLNSSLNNTTSFSAVSLGASMQNITVLLSILQEPAIPRIDAVSPSMSSSFVNPIITVVGDNLNMKHVSVCPTEAQLVRGCYNMYCFELKLCRSCMILTASVTTVQCSLPYGVKRGALYFFASSPLGASLGGEATKVVFDFVIDRVVPTVLSPYGGGVLTIFGAHFVPSVTVTLRNNNVRPSSDIACTVLNITEVQIVCVLDMFSLSEVDLVDNTTFLTVVHFPSMAVEATCGIAGVPPSEGTLSLDNTSSLCQVRFDRTILPQLTSVTPLRGQAPITLTVMGLYFTGNTSLVDESTANNLQIFVGQSQCRITFPIFFDRVLCDVTDEFDTSTNRQVSGMLTPYGYLGQEFESNLKFYSIISLNTVDPLVGSSMGGQSLTLYGSGFPVTQTPLVWAAGVACSVTSFNTSMVVCTTGSLGEVTNLNGAVVIQSASDIDARSTCCSYTYSAAVTPTVTQIAPTTGSEGIRATIVGTNFVSGVRVLISGIWISNAVVLSTVNVNLQIPRLPPATAAIRLSILGIGYAYHDPGLEKFSYSLSISKITPPYGSFNSGLMLTIQGSGLAINQSSLTQGTRLISQPATNVYICGKVCVPQMLDFAAIVCAVPIYVDQHYLQVYASHAEVQPLQSFEFTVYRRIVTTLVVAATLVRSDVQVTTSWSNVTDYFAQDTLQDGTVAARDPLIALNHTEVFLLTSMRHSRLSLSSLALHLEAIRNQTQNVSCDLMKSMPTVETFDTLDPAYPDWSSLALWNQTAVWQLYASDDGITISDVVPLFESSRYFLLTCRRLVAGETRLIAATVTGVVSGMSYQSGVCPINVAVSSVSGLYESCPDPQGKGCNTFAYELGLTAIAVGVTPPYTMSTGPTRISLTGSSFGLQQSAVSDVVVGGVSCQVQLAQESSLVCVTQGPLTYNGNTSLFGVTGDAMPKILGSDTETLFVAGKGRGIIIMDEPFVAVSPWSSPESWIGGVMPEEGAIVRIPEGTSILLDHSPPWLSAVIVEGALIIADVDLNIRLCVLVVRATGQVRGGNSLTPLTAKINFTFVHSDDFSPYEDVQYSSQSDEPFVLYKSILVDGGTFQFHGSPDATLFSKLQQTAKAGSNSIIIQDRVDWPVGSLIFITKGSNVVDEVEVKVVVGKTLTGSTSTLDLDTPLANQHSSSTEFYSATTLDYSCRVSLLSRNVLFQGDYDGAETASTRQGVTLTARSGAKVLLDGVSFMRCGKAGSASRRGLPAISFQNMSAPALTAVVQRSVVLQSFHRGITLIDCERLSFVSNIIYQTEGHGFSTLGGTCWNLALVSNIVARSQVADYSNSDNVPSNYYLTNPTVSMTNNAASGSSGHGIWFHLSEREQQPAHNAVASTRRCPAHYAIPQFNGNTVNGALYDGIHVSPSWTARERPCVDGFGQPGNTFVVSVLQNTLVFSCGGSGIALGPFGSLQLTSCYFVDNGHASVLAGSNVGTFTIESSLLSAFRVDGSTLVQNVAAASGRLGLRIPGGGLTATLSSVTFRNFTEGAAIDTCPNNDGEGKFDQVMPVFITASKAVITGNRSIISMLCGVVVLLDIDGAMTDLQREVFVLSGAKKYFYYPRTFTMCEVFNATSLSAAVANGIRDGTGSNASLLLCEASSTYSFYSIAVTMRGCSDCVGATLSFVYDNSLVARVYQDAVVDAQCSDGGERGRTVNFLSVDGRPSSVTTLTSFFSLKFQVFVQPVCGASKYSCSPPAGYTIGRYSPVQPTFPSTLIVPLAPEVSYIEVESLFPEYCLPSADSVVRRPFFVPLMKAGAGQPMVASKAANTDEVQAYISAPSTLQSTDEFTMVSTSFSTTTMTEGILVSPVLCPTGEWCAPPMFPNVTNPTATRVAWTSSEGWWGGAVPTPNTSVAVIPLGTTVFMNRNASVQALVVLGALVIDTDSVGAPLQLQCTHLIVLGTLTLASVRGIPIDVVVLTPNDMAEQFRNGTNSSVAPRCLQDPSVMLRLSDQLSLPCGIVFVAGRMIANGSETPTWWRTAEEAFAGSTSLPLPAQSLSLLRKGWRVGLTSSSARYPSGEIRVLSKSIDLSNISALNGTHLDALAAAWDNDHVATVMPGKTKAYSEMALLDKSIRLSCGLSELSVEAEGYCHVLVKQTLGSPYGLDGLTPSTMFALRHSTISRFGGTGVRTILWRGSGGTSIMSSALRSQLGGGMPAIFIAESVLSVNLTHVVVQGSHHAAFVVSDNVVNTPVLLSQVVVWGTRGYSSIVLGNNFSTLRDVLIVGTRYAVNYSHAAPVASLCSILDASGVTALERVVAAGSESEGICVPWTWCQTSFQVVNVAHSCAIGVFLYSPYASATPCRNGAAIGGFQVYRNSLIGLLSSDHVNLHLTQLASSSNPLGAYVGGRQGANGTTQISSSTFVGYSSSDFAALDCSPSYSLLSSYYCSDIFASAQLTFAAIMLIPTGMGSIPLGYDRSSVASMLSRSAEYSFNITVLERVLVIDTTFESLGAQGSAIAINPNALVSSYPLLTTRGIQLVDSPNSLFVPTSSPEGDKCGGCYPSQSFLLDDRDGSIRSANATAFVGLGQDGLWTLSCAPSGSFAVCPTTLTFGRLLLATTDDDPQFRVASARIVFSSTTSTAKSMFAATTPTNRGGGKSDIVTSILVPTGGVLSTTLTNVPRSLLLQFILCTAYVESIIRLHLDETDMRTTVWVNGVERPQSSHSITTAWRSGEWYRSPYLVGDDSSGDINDWIEVALGCEERLEIHALVFGQFIVTVNETHTSVAFGIREIIAATVQLLSGRPTGSVFVSAVVPAKYQRGHSTVTVTLEAVDSAGYNSTTEALAINKALDILRNISTAALTVQLNGLYVFHTSVVPAKTSLTVTTPPEAFLTLAKVLFFTGAISIVAGLGMLFYWYLLGLRYKENLKQRNEYSGIVFGDTVDELPNTDEAVVFETFPDMSFDSKARDYLDQWKIVSVRKGDAAFGYSVRSSESSPADRPLANANRAGGSVVNAFLSINVEDPRLRSPKTPSMKPPIGVDAAATRSKSFQLDVDHHGGALELPSIAIVRSPTKRPNDFKEGSLNSFDGAETEIRWNDSLRDEGEQRLHNVVNASCSISGLVPPPMPIIYSSKPSDLPMLGAPDSAIAEASSTKRRHSLLSFTDCSGDRSPNHDAEGHSANGEGRRRSGGPHFTFGFSDHREGSSDGRDHSAATNRRPSSDARDGSSDEATSSPKARDRGDSSSGTARNIGLLPVTHRGSLEHHGRDSGNGPQLHSANGVDSEGRTPRVQAKRRFGRFTSQTSLNTQQGEELTDEASYAPSAGSRRSLQP